MKRKVSNRDKTFWAVVIPVVILFFAFNTLPMIKGVIYSFTNYKGYGSYDYVGSRNYMDLFTDARVGKSSLISSSFKSLKFLINILAYSLKFIYTSSMTDAKTIFATLSVVTCLLFTSITIYKFPKLFTKIFFICKIMW